MATTFCYQLDEGSHSVLVMAGKLDQLTRRGMQAAAVRLLQRRPRSITVDLSDLEYADRSGVRLLVWMFKQARRCGGEMVVTGAANQPLALLQWLQLDRLFAQHRATSKAAA